jgi:hypothetical protein
LAASIPETLAQIPRGRSNSLARALASRIGRWTFPSLADLFFVSILLWLFAAGGDGWKGLLLDGDCGWHIRTGEYILDHHSVPASDLFSFTKAGQPWYAWEWLTDIGLAFLFRWAGLKAVVLAAGVIIAAYATIMIRRIFCRGADLFVGLFIGLMAVGAASVHFLARPHILTLLLLAGCLWIIDRDQVVSGKRIWLLVPITALWTNLHGGFLALIVILGGLTVGSAIESWLARAGWKKPLRNAALTLGCLLASLINPYGIGLHAHIAEYLRSDWIRNVVQEFQSPSFRSEGVMQFEVLLFLGLLSAAFCLRRGNIVEAMWIAGFAHLALGSVRHIPLFVTVAAPTIAAELSGWWRAWAGSERLGSKSIPGILERMGRDLAQGFRRGTVWPCLIVAVLASSGDLSKWPADFPEITFPVKMVRSHANLLMSHRVFSYDQWGDYLIYANYPRQRVFIDGRSDFYGPELGDQYLHAMQGRWDWRNVLNRHEIDVVLAPAEWPLASLLKQDSEWSLLADNGQALLFSRKLPIRLLRAEVRKD